MAARTRFVRLVSHRWITGVFAVAALSVSGEDVLGQADRDEKDRTQPRETLTRVVVPIDRIRIDDGDTAVIEWAETDEETVRILGIDAPETQHLPHDIPFDQPFSRMALGFAQGAFAAASEVELLRAEMLDPYDRTLGYFYINDKNYSVLIIEAGLAVETVSHYGDNGLPQPSGEVTSAAASAPPVHFEPPYQFRRRMREVTEWMKENGTWPCDEP